MAAEEVMESSNALSGRAADSAVNHLLSLPPELLLKVLSFLPARDKMCVRVTCRQLSSLVEDPSLWNSVSWDYTSQRYESGLLYALRVGASSMTNLQVCAHVPPSIRVGINRPLSSSISKCLQIRNLCLTGFDANLKNFQGIVSSLPLLEEAEFDCFMQSKLELKECLEAAKRLKALRLHVTSRDCAFIFGYLEIVWHLTSYKPSEVGIIHCYRDPLHDVGRDGNLDLPTLTFPPAAQKARLCVFSRGMPLANGLSRVPLYEVHLRAFVSVPVAECESLKLPKKCILALSRVPSGSEQYSLALYTNSRSLHPKPTSLSSFSPFISVLNLSNCMTLGSDHLESLAGAFPSLSWLNIQACIKALNPLTGLMQAASKCSRLKGLNMKQIHCEHVESVLKLWNILGSMTRLEYLALAPCLIRPAQQTLTQYGGPPHAKVCSSHTPLPDGTDVALVQQAITKMRRLTALEVGDPYVRSSLVSTCSSERFSDDELKLLSSLVGLQYLRLANLPPVSLCSGFVPVLGHLQQLKYLFISRRDPGELTLPTDPQCYASLRELCIDDNTFSVQDDLVDALGHNRKLTHLLLRVGDISRDSVSKIVSSFPSLVSFHLYVSAPVVLETDKHTFLEELSQEARWRHINSYDCRFHMSRCRQKEPATLLALAVESTHMRIFW